MAEDSLVRFGVTVPEKLLKSFDQQIDKNCISNRSEAIRQLIRDYISRSDWCGGKGMVYGSITISYNHHTMEATSILTDIQHDFTDIIVCTTHVHADHDHCLEVIVVKGDVDQVKKFMEALSGVRAVNNMSPAITSIL